MWSGGNREGEALSYHVCWPPVTDTIWTHCQNLIHERKEAKRGEEGLKQRRGKTWAIWERNKDRKRERETDKESVGVERKVEVKECEIWHFLLTHLFWCGAVQQISNMLMGKRPSADLPPQPSYPTKEAHPVGLSTLQAAPFIFRHSFSPVLLYRNSPLYNFVSLSL